MSYDQRVIRTPGQLRQDLWSTLNHVEAMSRDNRPPGFMSTWMDDTDSRRLTAYWILKSYVTNSNRAWLPAHMRHPAVHPGTESLESPVSAADSWREYGHAALVCNSARSLVLGNDQTVTVPDLSEETPDPRAVMVRDWLTGWAKTERLKAKLLVQEEHSVSMGDGVLVVSWSPELGRPILRGYDPGFYFPDLEARDNTPGWVQEYPPVVHLAWEYDRKDGVRILRRSTFRMTPLDRPVTAPWGGQRSWTCLFTVTEWDATRLPAEATVYTLTGGRVLTDEDLEVDFIPVVHVPNTETGEDFGESTLSILTQILTDLAQSDTDLARTAEESVPPVLMVTGAGAAQDLPGGTGKSYFADEGATAGYVENSRVLDAGVKQNMRLIETLAINARLGLTLLGRVVPAGGISGYSMQLGLTPAMSMLREMRRVREEKHPLILKFAQRLAIARGGLEAGPTIDAVIDLGPGLPSDQAIAVEQVTQLLTVKAITRATGVRMLMAAGLPIEDAQDEVDGITREDVASAVQVVDATGDPNDARERLGIPPQTLGPVGGPPATTAPPEPPASTQQEPNQ